MTDLNSLAAFTLFVLGLLALDLRVFHRRAQRLTLRQAVLWSGFWVALAVAFNLGVYLWRGPESALEFLAGYVIEQSLSLDNVFVFAVVFSFAAVPVEYQHKVLFWGILGALVGRAAFIAAGVALLERFHWILYLFGVFLVVSGMKFLGQRPHDVRPERNPVLRLARKIFSFTDEYSGASFFIRREGRTLATPLFLVMLMVETTDMLFAMDSIPAVFGVTDDPFIIYTSNVFAVVGLRAMYSALAGAMARFRYLRAGLSMVLVFVGAKMLVARYYALGIVPSLAIIVAILAFTIFASLRAGQKPVPRAPEVKN